MTDEEEMGKPDAQEMVKAIMDSDIAEVKDLLRWGADVNDEDELGRNMLTLAANYNRTEIARVLIQHGAKVGKKDKQGGTPIMCAAYNGHTPMIMLLLYFDADINAKDDQGKTALIHAVDGGSISAMRLLLEEDANPAICNLESETALSLAIARGYKQMARELETAKKSWQFRVSHEAATRSQLLATANASPYVIKRRVQP